MKLTDAKCKSAKPKEKTYKLFDGGGLYLEVAANGSKYWRLKYYFQNKEKKLAIGTYPFNSLAEARDERDKAKRLLQQNIDPSDQRRDERRKAVMESNNTFKAVALEWHGNQAEVWSEFYASEIMRNLNLHIFPELGRDIISKIDAPKLLHALRKIEDRGTVDLAKRLRQICSQVFRYGIQSGKCSYNPATDLIGALKRRHRKHFAAIEPKEIPELLLALEKNDARLFERTRRAIRLSLLTFVRPGELQRAVWAEIDFEKKEWRIPAERMKARQEHIVPLSCQAIELLEEQKKETGKFNTPYVFPSLHKPCKPISDNTVRVALQKLGFKDRMTAHGFRALARTAIREELDYSPDVIEIQLAHKPAGPLGAAYDRSKFIKQRHRMMQDWASYLDQV